MAPPDGTDREAPTTSTSTSTNSTNNTGGFRIRFYTEDDADVQRRRRLAAVAAARKEGGVDPAEAERLAQQASSSSTGPRGHRCDDRVEDLCRALAAGLGQMTDTVPPAWRLLRECFRAEPGLEPRGGYLFLAPGDAHWRDPEAPMPVPGVNDTGRQEQDDDPAATVAAAAAVAAELARGEGGSSGSGGRAAAAAGGRGGRGSGGGWLPSWLGGGGKG